MKKRLVSLSLALVVCLSFITPALAYGPPIDVYIEEGDAITVNVGDTGKLLGESVLNDSGVVWSSSDSSGVSVVADTGAYTAHRAGTFTLTATLKVGAGKPASIVVTVVGTGGTGGTTLTAAPSATKLMVDGKNVEIDAYVINENNYIKLRDLATIVNGTAKNFNVTWDGTKNAINLQSATAYTPVGGEMAKGDGNEKSATLNTSAIYVNGVEKALTAYLMGENNYFKLRDVMSAFDIYVGWDGPTGTATVETAKSYVNP